MFAMFIFIIFHINKWSWVHVHITPCFLKFYSPSLPVYFFYLGVLVTWYSIRLKFRELCKTASSILITAVLWKAHCARLSGDTSWNSQQASHGLCRYIHEIHGVPNCFQKIINAKTVHYSQQRHDDGIKVKWLWSTCCSCVIAAEHKQKPNAFVWCWVWSPATYLVNR